MWQTALALKPVANPADVWPAPGHAVGFDPYGVRCTTPVMQTLAYLSALNCGMSLAWLHANRPALESAAALPLAMLGIAAAALHDLGFNPAQGEMLHLLLRLPGSAAHALEQKEYGHKNFPFFSIDLENDPGPAQQKEIYAEGKK